MGVIMESNRSESSESSTSESLSCTTNKYGSTSASLSCIVMAASSSGKVADVASDADVASPSPLPAAIDPFSAPE